MHEVRGSNDSTAVPPCLGMLAQSLRQAQAEAMLGWHEELLRRCSEASNGTVVSEGAFRSGPALWVGRREVAHFDGERTLDLRLTKAEIRRRRDELTADPRVTLRGTSSDWIEVAVEAGQDFDRVVGLVVAAVEANRSTAAEGFPPTGADLERRRRFH